MENTTIYTTDETPQVDYKTALEWMLSNNFTNEWILSVGSKNPNAQAFSLEEIQDMLGRSPDSDFYVLHSSYREKSNGEWRLFVKEYRKVKKPPTTMQCLIPLTFVIASLSFVGFTLSSQCSSSSNQPSSSPEDIHYSRINDYQIFIERDRAKLNEQIRKGQHAKAKITAELISENMRKQEEHRKALERLKE